MDQVVPVSAHAPCDVGHSQTCFWINSEWCELVVDSKNRPIAEYAISSGWKAPAIQQVMPNRRGHTRPVSHLWPSRMHRAAIVATAFHIRAARSVSGCSQLS